MYTVIITQLAMNEFNIKDIFNSVYFILFYAILYRDEFRHILLNEQKEFFDFLKSIFELYILVIVSQSLLNVARHISKSESMFDSKNWNLNMGFSWMKHNAKHVF